MEFLLILKKGALLNLSHVGAFQNEVNSCNLRAAKLPRIPTCMCIFSNGQSDYPDPACTSKWFLMSIAKETSTVIK